MIHQPISLFFLTTSLVIQIYDLEHDSCCERHSGFALKCFRRHMLLESCSKCEILLKCCPKCEKCLRVLKMQNSAPNSKKCSKGAQRNRERPSSINNLSGCFKYTIREDDPVRISYYTGVVYSLISYIRLRGISL